MGRIPAVARGPLTGALAAIAHPARRAAERPVVRQLSTESVDFPSDEVADPRLGHAKQTRRLSLREPSRLDQLAEANHQICCGGER